MSSLYAELCDTSSGVSELVTTTTEFNDGRELHVLLDAHGCVSMEWVHVDWRELRRREQVERIRRILEGDA